MLRQIASRVQILDLEVSFEEFVEMLRDELCPAVVRDTQALEFIDAKPENISVAEASQKFRRDSTYVVDTITIGKPRIHAFSKRMRPEIQRYAARF